MAAHDNLSPQQFYHGTSHEFAPGEHVTPEHELGGSGSGGYTYMTTSPDTARNYGKHKAYARSVLGENVTAHAYAVTPTGHAEPDDTVAAEFGAYRSRGSLRVTGEI